MTQERKNVIEDDTRMRNKQMHRRGEKRTANDMMQKEKDVESKVEGRQDGEGQQKEGGSRQKTKKKDSRNRRRLGKESKQGDGGTKESLRRKIEVQKREK